MFIALVTETDLVQVLL